MERLVPFLEAISVRNLIFYSACMTEAVTYSSASHSLQEMGQSKNPNFVVLNLFGGVLTEKHEAELYLKDSGLDYTIVRPGGLTNDPLDGYNVIVRGEDTLFGLDTDPGKYTTQAHSASCAPASHEKTGNITV